MQQILVKAAEIAEAKVWSISVNRFPPQGVSGVIVISESHISTYTWPEYGYVALDFYACGNSGYTEKAVFYAVEAFGASTSHITEITRGIEGDRIFYHSFITWEEDFVNDKKKK